MPRELIIPPGAVTSLDSEEIIRAWRVGDGLHCSIAPSAWTKVEAWGLVFADLARHVADALHKAEGADVDDSIERIRTLFNAELRNPTDTPTGEFT